MKIIDKKGRLFGLVNVIDLLFLLIVLVAIVGGAKKFHKNIPVAERVQEGTVTFMVVNIRQLSVDQMVVGDTINHYDKGTLVGTIEDVKAEPFMDVLEDQGQFIQAPVPNRYQAFIKVKVDFSDGQDAYTVGGEPMRVGSEYRLKTKRTTFYGTCVNMSILDNEN